VPDSTLLSILTGAGVAGVFCVLFICGIVFPRSVVDDLKAENRELKEALDAERAAGKASLAAAQATKDILAAIQVGKSLSQPGSGP